MRRTATLIFLLSSFGLVGAPFATPHAHTDSDHDHVVVHGGHSHEFDLDKHHHAELATDHLTTERDEFGYVAGQQIATAQVVQLDVDIAPPTNQAGLKFNKVVSARWQLPDIPLLVLPTRYSSISDPMVTASSGYLHPPLRGPPSIIPPAS